MFSLLSEAEGFAADGQHTEAEDKLNELIEFFENRYISPYQFSLVYYYVNENEKALEFFEEVSKIREVWLN